MLDDAIEILTEQMIKDSFKNRNNTQKYIITKQELYSFSIKLIKFLRRMDDYYRHN